MEELDSKITYGYLGYRYTRAKHFLKSIVPNGGPTQILDGRNLFIQDYMLRTFPGAEKLFATQLGTSGYRRVLGVFPFVTAGGQVKFVLCTARHIYSYSPGDASPTDITGAITLTGNNTQYFDADYWTDTTSGYEPRILITNGKDAPFYWTGTGNCATLSNAPIARYITNFRGHVFMMAVTSGGVEYLQRDKRSNYDSATDWSGGTAGTTDLRQTAGELIGDLVFGDIRYIIKEDSTVMCRATGYSPPFKYDEQYLPIGGIAPNTILKTWRYNYGFFLGSDLNAYLVSRDGRFFPIGDDITLLIRALSNDQNLKYSFAFYYPAIDSIVLAIPSSNHSSNYCDLMFVFDMGHYVRTREIVWSPPIETGLYLSAGGVGRFRRFFKLRDVWGTLADYPTETLADFFEDAAFSQVIVGDYNGYVWKLNDGLGTIDGSAISWWAEFPDYKLVGQPGVNARLQEYEQIYRRSAIESAQVRFSTDGGNEFSTAQEIDLGGQGASDEELCSSVWPDLVGEKHRPKITGSGLVELVGQKFHYTDEGRF